MVCHGLRRLHDQLGLESHDLRIGCRSGLIFDTIYTQMGSVLSCVASREAWRLEDQGWEVFCFIRPPTWAFTSDPSLIPTLDRLVLKGQLACE